MWRDRKPVRKLDLEQLFQYGLQALGARALSASEIRGKLERKAERPDDVQAVLTRLREHGFLNDERFAEGYAAARRDSGSFGKMRVLRDLRQRRVAGTVAEKAVEEAFEDTDEGKLIEAWLQRKYRSVNLAEYLQEEKHLSSAFRKLRYAGFSSSASIRVLKRFASRADELEDAPEE
jgi:regulatory protein